MRIDKAKHREISARQLQHQVTCLYLKGLGKEAIEQALERVQVDIGEGEKVTSCTLPRIVVEVSNLGKGLVPFFICISCQKKVRAVYFLDMRIACRVCHGLTYKKQDKRQVLMNKLIAYDNFRHAYLKSVKPSTVRMAMEAEWAREAIIEKGSQRGVALLKRLQESS